MIYSDSQEETFWIRLLRSFATAQAVNAFPFLHFQTVFTRLANVKNALSVILCNTNIMLAPKYRKDKGSTDLFFTIMPRIRFRFTSPLEALHTTFQTRIKF
jgi:hypothetical protein